MWVEYLDDVAFAVTTCQSVFILPSGGFLTYTKRHVRITDRVPLLCSGWERSQDFFKAAFESKVKGEWGLLSNILLSCFNTISSQCLGGKRPRRWRLREIKWITAGLTQTLQWVRPADVNCGWRRREEKAVSSKESGKSKTYKTYRNLDIIQKEEEKSRQRNSVKKKLFSFLFHLHTSLTRHYEKILTINFLQFWNLIPTGNYVRDPGS